MPLFQVTGTNLLAIMSLSPNKIISRSHDYTWNFLYHPTTFEYSAAVIMSLKLQELMVYWEILMRTLETLRLVLIRLETLSVSIFLVVFQAY
jgi:hypothetical protein